MTGDDVRQHPALERRYRRLLAWYPWEHRRAYEEEMLAVLLAGARPGQRWPAPADAANVALAALRSRLGFATRAIADRSWSEAAATTGLLTAIMLCYLHALPLVRQLAWAASQLTAETVYWHPDPLLWIRSGLWTLTALAVLLGMRRLAPLLGWAAVAVELAGLPARYTMEPVSVLQALAQTLLGVLCAAALSVPAPRRAALAVLGRARLLTIGGIAALILLGSGLLGYLNYTVPSDSLGLWFSWLLLQLGVLVLAVAVWKVPVPVRRRLLVLLSPVAAVLLTVRLGLAGWAYSNQHMGHPVYLVPIQWVLLALVPPATLLVGFAVLRRREQTLRLVALGRAADRQPPEPGGQSAGS